MDRNEEVTAAKIMSTDFPRLMEIDDLHGKCHALWLLEGGETSEWNGTTCDCTHIQGVINCKLNQF